MRNVRAGERFVWRATRDSTRGAYCEFDLYLDADAKVPAAHRHPQQEERFTIVTGQVSLTADGETSNLGPDEVGIVPAGAAHSWRNTTGEPSHVVVRLTPLCTSRTTSGSTAP